MPWVTQPLLFKRAWNPTTKIYPTRFKELLPLKLRNEVSHKSNRGETVDTCLQQMTEMFECFKKNDFSQTVCAKEILSFKTCSDASRIQQTAVIKAKKSGVPTPGATNLTTKQTNLLLRRYPQHNPDVPDRWPR